MMKVIEEYEENEAPRKEIKEKTVTCFSIASPSPVVASTSHSSEYTKSSQSNQADDITKPVPVEHNSPSSCKSG